MSLWGLEPELPDGYILRQTSTVNYTEPEPDQPAPTPKWGKNDLFDCTAGEPYQDPSTGKWLVKVQFVDWEGQFDEVQEVDDLVNQVPFTNTIECRIYWRLKKRLGRNVGQGPGVHFDVDCTEEEFEVLKPALTGDGNGYSADIAHLRSILSPGFHFRVFNENRDFAYITSLRFVFCNRQRIPDFSVSGKVKGMIDAGSQLKVDFINNLGSGDELAGYLAQYAAP